MPDVELGFLEQCEPWKLESRLFPSKIGGKPAWLSLKSVPSYEDLQCQKCKQVMIFLSQVYAPYEDKNIDGNIWENNFHRTIFVFVCRNSSCNERNNGDNIKVFRSTLTRKNAFYSFDPPEERPDLRFSISKFVNLCNLCGISADKKCSKCKNVFYCCREHQIWDWKDGHKRNCSSDDPRKHKSKLLFSEWELITEIEEKDNTKYVDEQNELKQFEKLQSEGKTGTLKDVSESDLDAHVCVDEDKVFSKFKKRISDYSDQVLRYSRGGDPLLIAKEPIPEIIPDCEYCGGTRQFEFQIMPQMLSILKEVELDWGILLIYTCKNSCIGDSIHSYKKEIVFKQDVSLNKDQ